MASYKESGVDVEEGYRAVNKYKEHAKRTAIPGLLTGLGSFNGMFEVPKGYKNPVIVSGTDGVGTKLDIAFQMKKYDTVGIDCVAMSVNDILCSGVQTLFFLDYVACGKLDADVAADLVKGVADGCVDTGCALLGGETAEMPDFYDDGKYDLAGFGVGVGEKKEMISGENISEGDVLIGLSSTGVHSNGFSLVRKLVKNFNDPFVKRYRKNNWRSSSYSNPYLCKTSYGSSWKIQKISSWNGSRNWWRILRKYSSYVSKSKRRKKTVDFCY